MLKNSRVELNESLPEKVARYILEEIFIGKLKQGERLIESSIATRFHVSHAPVREALYILERKGVVERIPRKGVRIRVIDDKEVRDHIEALVGIVQLSSKLIENWDEKKYRQLKEIYLTAQSELESENIRDYVQTVAHFITVYVSYANNSVYKRITSEILFFTNIFAKANWNVTLTKKWHKQLSSCLKAMEENDFEQAAKRLTKAIWISLDGSSH